MSPVRRSVPSDTLAIANLIAAQLARSAADNCMISPDIDRVALEAALAATPSPIWVEDGHGRLRGHIYGATLDDPVHGRQTWTGPDGWSYEYEDILTNLLGFAHRTWRNEGSNAHIVWAPVGEAAADWEHRGYQAYSLRAVRLLMELEHPVLPEGWRIRRAGVSDLDVALAFDALIDLAQGVDVDSLSELERQIAEEHLIDLLDDPDTHVYFLDIAGTPVAQCVTFPLPNLRGSFEDTIFLAEVAVMPEWRGHGAARAVIETALADAVDEGFKFAEVRWHVCNDGAAALWQHLVFTPTFVQLRLDLADGL